MVDLWQPPAESFDSFASTSRTDFSWRRVRVSCCGSGTVEAAADPDTVAMGILRKGSNGCKQPSMIIQALKGRKSSRSAPSTGSTTQLPDVVANPIRLRTVWGSGWSNWLSAPSTRPWLPWQDCSSSSTAGGLRDLQPSYRQGTVAASASRQTANVARAVRSVEY